jgi:hypothetical protein
MNVFLVGEKPFLDYMNLTAFTFKSHTIRLL